MPSPWNYERIKWDNFERWTGFGEGKWQVDERGEDHQTDYENYSTTRVKGEKQVWEFAWDIELQAKTGLGSFM